MSRLDLVRHGGSTTHHNPAIRPSSSMETVPGQCGVAQERWAQEDYTDLKTLKTLKTLVGAMPRSFRRRINTAGISNAKVGPSFADETPLLSKDGGATVATSVNSDDREQGSVEGIVAAGVVAKPTASQMMKSMTALLISAAGMAAAICSFIFAPAIIVYVAGSLCILNFPMVSYKERKILILPSQKKTVAALEDMVEFLKSESGSLEKDIEYMSGYAARFGDVEQELQEVTRAQGSNVDKVIELVRLNEETMDLMKENLRQKVVQDVIGIIMKNGSLSKRIDRVEAKLLALKISVKLEAYGVTFDEDKFLQAVALDSTPWGVVGTVKKLLPPNDEQTDDVSIASDMDDIFDMFYMSDQRRGSALDERAVSEGRHASLASRRRANFDRRHSLLTRQVPSGSG